MYTTGFKLGFNPYFNGYSTLTVQMIITIILFFVVSILVLMDTLL